MGTPGNALVGYAVLRANYNASAPNYLDNFSPFVLSVLAESGKSYLERHIIAEAIRSEFGIEIPAMVISRLVRRTNREGLTQPVGTNAVEITPKGLQSAPAIATEVTQYRSRQAELVQVFTDFVEAKHPDSRSLLPSDVGASLAEYFDRHAVPLLDESLRGRIRAKSAQPGIDFLVSSFVTELSLRDQTRFSYVVEAAKGAMLASVLLLDTSTLADSLNDVTLIIDTPVLMDSLGFHGEVPQAAIGQVFELARIQGARLVAFDHNVTELEGILDSVSQSLRRGSLSRSTGAGYLHFAEQGASPADLAVIQQQLPKSLAAIGLEVVARPNDYYEYGLDESKLETLIQRKVHYLQDAARINDVVSLSSTHRLRKGHRSRSFERCSAVLITSNTALVLGALEFGESDSFPLAMTSEALASILWVRSPATSPDAPKQMLLASAYAGMQPSTHLWTQYLSEVDRLEDSQEVSADEAIVLRSSHFSRDAVMQETRGETDALQSDAPLAVLERIQREASEPLEVKVRELEALAAKSMASATDAEMLQAEQQKANEESRARVAELESASRLLAETVQATGAVRSRIRQRAEDLARRRIRGMAWVVRAAALAAAIIAIVVLLASPDPANRTGVLIVGIAGLLAFAAPFLPTLDNILGEWERRFADNAERTRLLDVGFKVLDATKDDQE